MRSLAGRIAERMTREFRLFDEREGGRGRHQPEAEDIYEIRALAGTLSGDLGGRPVDEGRLARSLSDFAQESASLFAARPEAASLDAIARAIAAREPAQAQTLHSVDTALGQIDQTTRDIASSRPR
ncbi:hypothetical protein ACXYN8_00730 [Altererythrobacter sp. CAU 1778]